MTSNEKRKEWMRKRGLYGPTTETTVKRTEGSITYEYPVGFDLSYTHWCSEQWNQKVKPSFSGFYAQLSEARQNLITIKNNSDAKQ